MEEETKEEEVYRLTREGSILLQEIEEIKKKYYLISESEILVVKKKIEEKSKRISELIK